MRRLTALILILLLCGCAATATEEPQSDVLPETEEEVQEPVVEEERAEVITYAVEPFFCEDTALAEDGTELAAYRFDLPMLMGVWEDGTFIVEP